MAKINLMNTLDPIGLLGFPNLFEKLFPQNTRKRGRKVLTYLRLHTHLITAYHLMNKEQHGRAFELLMTSLRILQRLPDEKERPAYERIKTILKKILTKKDVISQELINETHDPHHVHTHIMLAQNICILRILKLTNE
ncbi:MAG: hypothetical protein V1735_07185 [Nanoarchaeota archaeon]